MSSIGGVPVYLDATYQDIHSGLGEIGPGCVTLDGATGARTDDDGRIRFDGQVEPGRHTLTFETGAYFGDRPHFHPEVTVAFVVDPSQEHHHVALLLGPYSYTTYRGS